MRQVERELARAIRRLAEHRGGEFTGKVRLHCAHGRLQRYEVSETREAGGEGVDLTEERRG